MVKFVESIKKLDSLRVIAKDFITNSKRLLKETSKDAKQKTIYVNFVHLGRIVAALMSMYNCMHKVVHQPQVDVVSISTGLIKVMKERLR